MTCSLVDRLAGPRLPVSVYCLVAPDANHVMPLLNAGYTLLLSVFRFVVEPRRLFVVIPQSRAHYLCHFVAYLRR